MKNEKSRPFRKGKRHLEHSNKRSKERNPRPATAGTDETSGELVDNFVFGFHVTTEALQQGHGNKSFLQEDTHDEKTEQLKQAAKEQAVPVKRVPKAKLDTMNDHDVYQGTVLAITTYQYLTLEKLLEQTEEKIETPSFLVLSGLEDPHSFSSILRTVDATGMNGIIIPERHAVGITPTVTKASIGAVEHIPVARMTNLTQGIVTLKENQLWVSGTDVSGADYRCWSTRGTIALIIGNEGHGISQGLHKEADKLLMVPITGHVQSLNTGVAAGLLVYEVYRGRNPLQKKAVV